MRTFLYCEAGFVEKDQWLPNSWVNVECPTPEDIHYLTNQFNVPESFLSDIADTDERPRIEYEGNWLLTIIRIPVQSQEQGIPFTTIPLGIRGNTKSKTNYTYDIDIQQIKEDRKKYEKSQCFPFASHFGLKRG